MDDRPLSIRSVVERYLDARHSGLDPRCFYNNEFVVTSQPQTTPIENATVGAVVVDVQRRTFTPIAHVHWLSQSLLLQLLSHDILLNVGKRADAATAHRRVRQ